MFDYNLVDEVIDRIIEVYSPRMIVVFGSVARGEAVEGSDLDMLVVMDSDVEDYHKRTIDVILSVSDIRLSKDIFVLTPEEFESRVRTNPMLREIMSTGVVAYEA